METSRGLSVTTTSPSVIDCINHFHQQILGAGLTPELILDAVKQHPDNLLLHTYAAAFYLYGQRDPATAIAKEHLFQAEKLVRTVNLREKLIYTAVQEWMNRHYEKALVLFTAITELYPRDTLAAKFAEWLFYCTGQACHAREYLTLCQHMANENQDESHFIAMHSFALELSRNYIAAQQQAEKAILLEPITPWAQHTLAHVYLNTDNIMSGITVIETFRDSWTLISPLMRGHNTWHLALFFLALRQEDKVMALYPDIFGTSPQVVTEQIDAISLLWRMDLAGLPQTKQFKRIADYFEQAPFEQYMGFNSLHYIYCLARLGREEEIQKSITSISTYAASLSQGYAQSLWLTVIVPFSKAVHAFATHDFLLAYKCMVPVISRYAEIGGSDAQSELLTQTYLACLLRLNKRVEATEFFHRYLFHYQDTPLAEFWFYSKEE